MIGFARIADGGYGAAMSENVTSELIFETLKAMQAELVASRERDAEVMRRLAGIETAVARLGRDQAPTYADQMADRHGMSLVSRTF